MKKSSTSSAALGIYVTPSTIEAVLLEQGDAKARVVHRFIRPRVQRGVGAGAGSFETVLPGLKGSDDADYTIEVGDGSSGETDTFLPPEFSDLPSREDDGDEPAAAAAGPAAAPFTRPLREILGECSKLGHPAPRLAFCVGPPDVSYVEVSTPAAREEETSGGRWFGRRSNAEARTPGRAALLKQLEQVHGGAFDAERVAFLPMAADGERPRHLAIVPAPGDAVTATLDVLRAAPAPPAATARLLDAEASLYLDLVRACHPLDADQNTAIVRIGAKDTLVLFMKGATLQHGERLRSLTASETPETICSRILLQQDEQKIGTLHNLFVLSTGREERLLEGFRTFYADAAVQSLHRLLTETALEATDETMQAPGVVPAAGVALRLLDEAGGTAPAGADGPRAAVNLLPRRLLRRRRRWRRLAWHRVALVVVLLATTGFFSWRYVEGEERLRAYREAMRSDPVEVTASPAALQARVDSLQGAQQRYTHALQTLDSLLVGSNQWSRMMERTSRLTGTIRNVWLSDWKPRDGQAHLDGVALTRSKVAALARQLDARIDRLEYADITTEGGDVRVFPFTLVAPVPKETPRVARYLQEVAAGTIHPGDGEWTVVDAPTDERSHPHP